MGASTPVTAVDLRCLQLADVLISHPCSLSLRASSITGGDTGGLPQVDEWSIRGPRPTAGSTRRELRTVSTARAVPARRAPYSRKPVTRLWVMILRSGLDHAVSLFAPCLLGCPGTTRYQPSAAGTPPRRVAGILPGASVKMLVDCGNRTPEQRTLNPRVRGSSPWRRTRTDLGFYLSRSVLCVRFAPMLDPC